MLSNKTNQSFKSLFSGFLSHCFLLLLLLIVIVFLSTKIILSGAILGISSITWFIIALLIPIIHQFYVWFCWRVELYYNKISRVFGKEKGFKLYSIGFAVLIVARLLTIIVLAVSTQATLLVNCNTVIRLIGIICLILSAYLMYSVARYFGFKRAFGIDHFDETYRNKEFVKKGIFRFANNGMYIYGFLLLWVPGLFLLSSAALIAALFNHIYIWIHYYCVELPDIKFIYKQK